MREALLEDRQINLKLARTWYPFFQRYGRLTAVQRKAIPLILNGDNLLVCAATASGKTEAACAPLVEKHIERNGAWTILYISPTRALVNDLYQRLESPISSLGLQIKKRTGEYKSNLNSPPHILLTTPESFDSLLSRGRLDNHYGHLLANVVAVVIDEVHLFYGTSRGEQIRWLLERLRRLREHALRKKWSTSKDVQIVALSATVPVPEQILEAYLPLGKKLIISGHREIEAEIYPYTNSIEDQIEFYINRLEHPEKILLFCNSRKRVDHLANQLILRLEKNGYEVYAHHGSLSKGLREKAETVIRNKHKVLVVATSTLELGIDIGDIDIVMFDEPAPDMPSFLQRIGRGNRRTNRTRVILFSSTYLNQLIQKGMVEAAKRFWLGTSVKGNNYAVIRQQIFSYLFQSPNGFRSRESLVNFVNSLVDGEIGELFINYLLAKGELIENVRGIRLSEELFDKAVRGEFHSNIEDTNGYEIIDEKSGEKIAKDISKDIKYRSGDFIGIAGKELKILNVTGYYIGIEEKKNSSSQRNQNEIEEKKNSSQQRNRNEIEEKKNSSQQRNRNEIEEKKNNSPQRNQNEIEENWAYTSSGNKSTEHALILRWYLNLGDTIWPKINLGQYTFLFHLGGVRRRLLLELLRDFHLYHSQIVINDYYIIYESQQEKQLDWLRFPPMEEMQNRIKKRLRYIEDRLGRPKANLYIPMELRIKEIESWLNIDEERKLITQANFSDQLPHELKETLIKIVGEALHQTVT